MNAVDCDVCAGSDGDRSRIGGLVVVVMVARVEIVLIVIVYVSDCCLASHLCMRTTRL